MEVATGAQAARINIHAESTSKYFFILTILCIEIAVQGIFDILFQCMERLCAFHFDSIDEEGRRRVDSIRLCLRLVLLHPPSETPASGLAAM